MGPTDRKHKPLINGFTLIYECLASPTLIQKHNILYPPHTNPGFDSPKLNALGYNDETVSLIQNLPFLPHELIWPALGEDDILIAPHPKALTYLGKWVCQSMDGPWNHPRRGNFGEEEEEKLEP